jgi:hypothetical protein
MVITLSPDYKLYGHNRVSPLVKHMVIGGQTKHVVRQRLAVKDAQLEISLTRDADTYAANSAHLYKSPLETWIITYFRSFQGPNGDFSGLG